MYCIPNVAYINYGRTALEGSDQSATNSTVDFGATVFLMVSTIVPTTFPKKSSCAVLNLSFNSIVTDVTLDMLSKIFYMLNI